MPRSIAELRAITNGRIIPVGKGMVRNPSKRADYLLVYERGLPLESAEVKAKTNLPTQGPLQAKKILANILANALYAEVS